MTAIAHRDQAGFVRQAILYVGVFAAIDGGRGPLPVHRGAARPALARLADPADHPALPRGPDLPPAQGVGRDRQPRPADRRGHPGVHDHHAVVHPDLPERDARGPVVLGRALDDQPAALRRRRRVRGARHAGDDLAGPAARRAELPPVRPGGQLPRGPDPRPRERRVGRPVATRRPADGPAAAPHRRAGRTTSGGSRR